MKHKGLGTKTRYKDKKDQMHCLGYNPHLIFFVENKSLVHFSVENHHYRDVQVAHSDAFKSTAINWGLDDLNDKTILNQNYTILR